MIKSNIEQYNNISDHLVNFRTDAYDALMKVIDMSSVINLSRDELKIEIENFLIFYTQSSTYRISKREQSEVADDIVNDMLGFGPLEKLLADDSITDIVANKYDDIYIEKNGMLSKSAVKFRDETHAMQIAHRIAQTVGRRVDTSNPICDARLQDGSRVNIVFPPIAIDGISISIRKFSAKKMNLDDITELGSMSLPMLSFLKLAARCALNILVSGGTGAGKTTLLNAISSLINKNERVVTCEDAAELRLHLPHVVRLESRDANIEGNGEITIRDLVRTSLRMRPDRIIIGEVRGDEAIDMLQAMNTGHDGSMSTVHANSASEALVRLENMILMSGVALPIDALRTQIASAVDVIIHVERMHDGSKKITEIVDVSGVTNGVIQCVPLFKFIPEGVEKDKVTGHFESYQITPSFINKTIAFGLKEQMMKVLAIK